MPADMTDASEADRDMPGCKHMRRAHAHACRASMIDIADETHEQTDAHCMPASDFKPFIVSPVMHVCDAKVSGAPPSAGTPTR